MKRFARTLALLSLSFSSFQFLRPKAALGPILAILVSPVKLLAGSLAPLTAVLGALAAVLGLFSRSPLSLLAGGLGAALSLRHLHRVTRPHDGFRVFGPNWRESIPAGVESRMLRRRWTWLLPPPPPARHRRDLPFWTIQPADNGGRSKRQLLCDLWLPDTRPSHPVPPSGLAFVFFHGGGWHQFDKDSLTRPWFRHLASQGHVVMDVAYRLYPETGMTGMVADGKRAVAWMKAHAARYGVDPERIVVAGGSAGAHLALLVAYTPGLPELTPANMAGVDTSVRGVVAFYPPADLRAYMAYNDYPTTKIGPLELTSPREVVPGALGGTPAQVPGQYDLFAPASHVTAAGPCTLLVSGEHDHVVPVEPIRALHRALLRAGTPSIYVEFPATEHAFDLVMPRISPAAQAAWHDVDRFLALLSRGSQREA